MDKALNMALVGASGVVGQKILQLLEKKEIKIDNLFSSWKIYCWPSYQFSKS